MEEKTREAMTCMMAASELSCIIMPLCTVCAYLFSLTLYSCIYRLLHANAYVNVIQSLRTLLT